MKATGIVRRIDDLGRVVIPKEIRRTMRIREDGSSQTTLTVFTRFCWSLHRPTQRTAAECCSLRCSILSIRDAGFHLLSPAFSSSRMYRRYPRSSPNCGDCMMISVNLSFTSLPWLLASRQIFSTRL